MLNISGNRDKHLQTSAWISPGLFQAEVQPHTNSQGLCILLGLGCAPSGEWSIAEHRGAPIIYREPMAPGLEGSQQWDPLKQSSYWNIAKTFWDTMNLLFSVLVLHDVSWKVKAGNYISQAWSVLFWKGLLLIGTKTTPDRRSTLCLLSRWSARKRE